jgi:hypothetical protein
MKPVSTVEGDNAVNASCDGVGASAPAQPSSSAMLRDGSVGARIRSDGTPLGILLDEALAIERAKRVAGPTPAKAVPLERFGGVATSDQNAVAGSTPRLRRPK